MHNFDHEQVNGGFRDSDDVDGINDDFNQSREGIRTLKIRLILVSHFGMELSGQGGFGDVHQKSLVDFLGGDFEFFEELEAEVSGFFVSFANNPRMNTFLNKSFGLLEEFSNEQNVGGGTITNGFILSGGGSGDHGSSGMLNLLISILIQF